MPTTNAEKAEVDQSYEHLQDLLDYSKTLKKGRERESERERARERERERERERFYFHYR